MEVGDSPMSPMLLVLANAVEDMVINVGQPPYNDEETALHPWEVPTMSRGAFFQYG
jgi:hypothetical protein